MNLMQTLGAAAELLGGGKDGQLDIGDFAKSGLFNSMLGLNNTSNNDLSEITQGIGEFQKMMSGGTPDMGELAEAATSLLRVGGRLMTQMNGDAEDTGVMEQQFSGLLGQPFDMMQQAQQSGAVQGLDLGSIGKMVLGGLGQSKAPQNNGISDIVMGLLTNVVKSKLGL